MTDGARPVREAAPPAPPAVGDTVRDSGRDRVGVVMARQGPYVQLRPLGGGREWDADPARVRPLSQAELLSARVADANTRSRTGLGELPSTMRTRASQGGEAVPIRSGTTHLAQGGGHGQDDGEGDGLPGQPWSPTEDPHPDGSTPPGDGDHRK